MPRLARIRIARVFGEGSHDIDVAFKLDERVTVLHGLNGTGKTLTLKLLDAVWHGRYALLLTLPLASMELFFEDGQVLRLQPRPDKDMQKSKVSASLARAEGDAVEAAGVLRLNPAASRAAIQDVLFWRYRQRDDDGAAEDPTLLDIERGLLAEGHIAWAEPAWLSELREGLPPLKLIPTDRLVHHAQVAPSRRSRQPPPPARLMVQHLSEQMRERVAAADRQYREISTRLDASLADRILTLSPPTPDEARLRAQASDLDALEVRLCQLGLLKAPQGRPLPEPLSPEQRALVALILQDRQEKLRAFRPLLDKAERLLTSLSGKLHPKSVRLDVERGYQVFAASGQPLDLTQLSSGEQHELVMLHELLFEVESGSLVLIDEPELSLHVSWQDDLLDELLDIARLAELDFVLATHSPYIIGAHEGLMVRLGPPPRPRA